MSPMDRARYQRRFGAVRVLRLGISYTYFNWLALMNTFQHIPKQSIPR